MEGGLTVGGSARGGGEFLIVSDPRLLAGCEILDPGGSREPSLLPRRIEVMSEGVCE